MFTYTISTLNGLRAISRSDGVGIPNDRDNRDARLFAFEWLGGAAVTSLQTGLPIVYSVPEITLLDLVPVLDWPAGT